jgi:hypothetical protein
MHQGRSETLAVGLAWFSIALGIAELAAPRLIARATGMRGREGLVRLYGLREIATGVGILMASDRKPWMWGRVAGDALDLATLAAAPKRKPAIPLAAVGGVAAIDVGCALALGAESRQPARVFDYSERSGFPRPPSEMRGTARRHAKAGSEQML